MTPLNLVGKIFSIPLRSLSDPHGKEATSLLKHSQNCHPAELRIKPDIVGYPSHNRVQLQYAYKGEIIRIMIEVPSIHDHAGIINNNTLSRSEFGALLLEQTFGRAPTNEECFTSESGGFEHSLGPVRGDIVGQMIEVQTPQVRITIEGTDVGEAGIYVTKAWRVLKGLMNKVSEGVQSLHLCFQQGVYEAVVASPVQLTIGLPDLERLGDNSVEAVITDALKMALNNKTIVSPRGNLDA
jgi:hypothetical protein